MFEKNEEFEARKPDFSSIKGVMVWKNLDKNNKEYLAVKIPILNLTVNCFQLKEADNE